MSFKFASAATAAAIAIGGLLTSVALMLLSPQDRPIDASFQNQFASVTQRYHDLAKRIVALRTIIAENNAQMIEAAEKQDASQLKIHSDRFAELKQELTIVSEQTSAIGADAAEVQKAFNEFNLRNTKPSFGPGKAMLIVVISTLIGIVSMLLGGYGYAFYATRKARLATHSIAADC